MLLFSKPDQQYFLAGYKTWLDVQFLQCESKHSTSFLQKGKILQRHDVKIM